jgi:hypothetical protein
VRVVLQLKKYAGRIAQPTVLTVHHPSPILLVWGACVACARSQRVSDAVRELCGKLQPKPADRNQLAGSVFNSFVGLSRQELVRVVGYIALITQWAKWPFRPTIGFWRPDQQQQ